MEIPNKNMVRDLQGEKGHTRLTEGRLQVLKPLKSKNRLKAQKSNAHKFLQITKKQTQGHILKSNCNKDKMTIKNKSQLIFTRNSGRE